jgi:DNA-binding SARP family transcriptional activator
MASDLRIWLLGSFRAEVDALPVPAEAWRRSTAKALIKLLALAPGHRLHREQLTEALWPDADADAGAASLRKAIHFARHAIGTDHIRLRDEVVSLEALRLWVDVEAFEAAAQSGNAERALDLYGGDLLLEDRFEPWSEARREQLRARLAELLLDWAAELDRRGDSRAATLALERLVDVDPLNEEAYCGLVRLNALAGHRHVALRWFRRLEDRLREELGVEPSQQARQLHDDVAAGRLHRPAVPDTQDAHLGGEERKLVTVLSADIGSNARGDTSDPERARRAREAGYAVARRVLQAWGGVSDSPAGGSVMAVFGVPAAREDDVSRALRAGLEILEESGFAVRVGVDTGEVIAAAGQGADLRGIAGEVLDVASRLREVARPGTLLATERTRRAARDDFRFGEPVRLDLPGTTAAVTARRLLVAVDDARAKPRRPPLLVGRDAELSTLRSLVDEVVDTGRPRLLSVVGVAGVGKSRLVQETVDAAVERHPEMRVLRGRCLSAGEGVTYWALGEILREACGISLGEPAAMAQKKLRQGLRRVLRGHVDDDEVDRTIFALAATAGVSLPGNPLQRLQPQAVAEEITRAWPRYVTALAAAGPLLLIIEDLHWAGDQLLQMVDRIVARSHGPLVLVTTARPEVFETESPFRAAADAVSSISLRPLTGVASRQLLDAVVPGDALTAERRAQVLDRAEGNPYFLEELAAHIAQGDTGALPDTLHSLLRARVDALQPLEKRVLQEASVVGRVFWVQPVARNLAGGDVSEALVALERRGLILARAASTLAGQTEFAFKHALLRDVAYASLPTSRRTRAHADVGAWIEELTSNRDELIELLAHHYAAAAAEDVADVAWGDAESRESVRAKAVASLLEAGVAARRRFAITKAVELHRSALTLATTQDEQLRAYEELGDDHESAYQGDDGGRRYEQALELARADPSRAADRSRLCRKLAGMMAMNPGAFRVNPDPMLVEQLIAEGLAAAPDDLTRAHVLVVKGASARLWRGSEPFGQGTRPDPVLIDDRIDDVTEAMRIGEMHGLEDLVDSASSALTILYGIAGRYEQMLDTARRDLDRVERAPSRAAQVDILRTVATLTSQIAGRFQEGLDLAQRSHALVRDTNPHLLMHCTYAALAALFHLGRWQEMQAFLVEHVAAFREEPAVGCNFVRDGPVIGATLLWLMGEPARARALADMVGDPKADLDSATAWQARFAVVSGDPDTGRLISAGKALEGRAYGPQHALALLEALVALEDWPAVTEFLPEARAAVLGNALLAPFCDRADGLVDVASGRTRMAAEKLHRALEGFVELAAPYEAARTREHLAALPPQTVAARALLEAALETYERLGAAPRAAAVRDVLSSLAVS